MQYVIVTGALFATIVVEMLPLFFPRLMWQMFPSMGRRVNKDLRRDKPGVKNLDESILFVTYQSCSDISGLIRIIKSYN